MALQQCPPLLVSNADVHAQHAYHIAQQIARLKVQRHALPRLHAAGLAAPQACHRLRRCGRPHLQNKLRTQSTNGHDCTLKAISSKIAASTAILLLMALRARRGALCGCSAPSHRWRKGTLAASPHHRRPSRSAGTFLPLWLCTWAIQVQIILRWWASICISCQLPDATVSQPGWWQQCQ